MLSLKYRVICPDLPGFGKSDSPLKPWDVSDYTNWAKGFLKHLGIKKLSLIAHSFGGRIAIKILAGNSKLVSRAVLCAPAGILEKKDPKNRFIELMARAGKSFFFSETLKELARKVFYFFLRRRDYVKAEGVMRETFKKVIGEDLSPSLKDIKTKTLIVWGKKDRMVPVKQSYFLKEKIEDSELKILARRSHSPHLEEPEELSQILINFLN